ncbi:unnamed protein product [Peronospora belbahrii]|uniref:SBP-type domain-containing protein n=1 Tax=Peronospora belbahrii TaxID=622444 RepID=A0ABN8CKT0_9STRA|nr:unnamed protein product [Peronospora belbahrii]
MLSREMQCAYRSKFCNAPRATKLDGTLHKLCDFHRRKANANQQRLHKRKKRILEQQTASSPRFPNDGHIIKRVRLGSASLQGTTEPIDGFTFHNSFDQLEVKILEVLLFGSECGAIRQSPQLLMKDEDCFLYPVSPTTPSMALEPVSDGPWPVML